MNAPFHTIRDVNDGFSLTLLNGDVVDSLSARHRRRAREVRRPHRIGAGREDPRREAARSSSAARAWGPRASTRPSKARSERRRRRPGWSPPARAISTTSSSASTRSGIVLGFYDATAKLTHHAELRPDRSPWASSTAGPAGGARRPTCSPRTATPPTPAPTSPRLQWRWLPSSRAWLESVAFVSRETGQNRNRRRHGHASASASTQWGLRADATRVLGPSPPGGGPPPPPPLRGRRGARVRRRAGVLRVDRRATTRGAPRAAPTCRTPGRASATA